MGTKTLDLQLKTQDALLSLLKKCALEFPLNTRRIRFENLLT